MSRPQPQLQTVQTTRSAAKNRGGDRAAHHSKLARGLKTNSKAEAALIDIDKPLTDMQKQFVKNWASGESIVTSSIRAGYQDGGSYGYRMAAQPNILKLYNEEKRLYEEAGQLTRKKVMDMLLESYEYAKLAGEPASMVAAARECGKMAGYYEPVRHRVDISVSGNIVLDRMNRMSDAELLKLITDGEVLTAIEDAS